MQKKEKRKLLEALCKVQDLREFLVRYWDDKYKTEGGK